MGHGLACYCTILRIISVMESSKGSMAYLQGDCKGGGFVCGFEGFANMLDGQEEVGYLRGLKVGKARNDSAWDDQDV